MVMRLRTLPLLSMASSMSKSFGSDDVAALRAADRALAPSSFWARAAFISRRLTFFGPPAAGADDITAAAGGRADDITAAASEDPAAALAAMSDAWWRSRAWYLGESDG